ncbi:MAG: hypothetical protein AB8F26_01710 [Phycisphaerales bacterium]
MPHQSQERSDYNTTLPGDNPYDEARRAASDLCRLTRMWVLIAEANEEALNPTFTMVYDDENGDELAVQRVSRMISPNTRREDLRREVRKHWPVWTTAVERLKTALLKVTDSEIDAAKLDARRGMMQLSRIFFAPIILVHDEKPGDQLLGAGGPMYCKAGGSSAIHRQGVEKFIEPIADFSDLMATYDVHTTVCETADHVTSNHSEPDSGHGFQAMTEAPVLRLGKWFDQAT